MAARATGPSRIEMTGIAIHIYNYIVIWLCQARPLYYAPSRVNNLNDGVAWGLFPLFFASGGASIRDIAVLAFVYPASWVSLNSGREH